MNVFDEILTQAELDELYEELKQEREAYREQQRAGIDMIVVFDDSDRDQFCGCYRACY
mgnify:CR=1 FL=1